MTYLSNLSSATQRAEKRLQNALNEIRHQQQQQWRQFQSIQSSIALLGSQCANPLPRPVKSQNIIKNDLERLPTIEKLDGENSQCLDPVSFQHLERWETQLYTPLTFQLRRKNECSDKCTCSCHTLKTTVQTLHTPSFLTSIIGYLFVTFSGMPFLQPGCSDQKCRNYSTRGFRATYRFPKWAVAAALQVAAGNSTTSGDLMTLFVQRRISGQDENGIMDMCVKGSVEGIKKLLINRSISPNDAELTSGLTPLHVSIPSQRCWPILSCTDIEIEKISVHEGRLETTRLLLQFGANPNIERDTGMYVTFLLS